MSDNWYYVKYEMAGSLPRTPRPFRLNPLQLASWRPLYFLGLSFFLLVAGTSAAQTWQDEFNGGKGAPINSAKWTFDTGNLHVNNELEIYCAPKTAKPPCDPANPNAFIDGDGHLVIRHHRVGDSWTSARLKTQGLKTFRYGRLEARIKMPSHTGLWPAFWMLGDNIGSVDWPACGEVDIMENWPEIGATANSVTLHGKGYSGGGGISFRYDFPNGKRVDTDFHTYGIIWSANKIQFYFDDPANIVSIRTPNDLPPGTNWRFNHPFFLILNMAVGGDLGGAIDAATATAEPMLVDYVRYYHSK